MPVYTPSIRGRQGIEPCIAPQEFRLALRRFLNRYLSASYLSATVPTPKAPPFFMAKGRGALTSMGRTGYPITWLLRTAGSPLILFITSPLVADRNHRSIRLFCCRRIVSRPAPTGFLSATWRHLLVELKLSAIRSPPSYALNPAPSALLRRGSVSAIS